MPDRTSAHPGGVGSRAAAALYRRPWARAALHLTPPLAWFFVIYLASLAVLLLTSLWSVDPFTNDLHHQVTFANFREIFTATYLRIIWRTVVLAALVTITDIVLALPFAYFMARVATRRIRAVLFVAGWWAGNTTGPFASTKTGRTAPSVAGRSDDHFSLRLRYPRNSPMRLRCDWPWNTGVDNLTNCRRPWSFRLIAPVRRSGPLRRLPGCGL